MKPDTRRTHIWQNHQSKGESPPLQREVRPVTCILFN